MVCVRMFVVIYEGNMFLCNVYTTGFIQKPTSRVENKVSSS